MNALVRVGLAAVALLWQPARAGEEKANTVVLGRLVSFDYLKHYDDPDDLLGHGWYKAEIVVRRTLSGKVVSGRITAVSLQHVGFNERFQRAARLFVLAPIEDAEDRKTLKSEYYLVTLSEPREMYCIGQDPQKAGVNTDEIYTKSAEGFAEYCFALPDKN